MPISLLALADRHIPTVLAACADWEELAQYGAPYWRPRSEAELRRKVAAMSGPHVATEYNFVLVEDDGRLVGECSLHAIDWRNRVAQVGVCIWAPDDRRCGYGREGVQQLIAWGVDHVGLARLEAWIVDGNEPSVRLFVRLGFEHEGALRQRYQHAGVRRDMHVLGRLA